MSTCKHQQRTTLLDPAAVAAPSQLNRNVPASDQQCVPQRGSFCSQML
jgi:hypothetical protein